MKLVIDISETSYEEIKNHTQTELLVMIVWNAIQDGIVINSLDFKKLRKIQKLVDYWNDYNSYDTVLGIKEILEEQNEQS